MKAQKKLVQCRKASLSKLNKGRYVKELKNNRIMKGFENSGTIKQKKKKYFEENQNSKKQFKKKLECVTEEKKKLDDPKYILKSDTKTEKHKIQNTYDDINQSFNNECNSKIKINRTRKRKYDRSNDTKSVVHNPFEEGIVIKEMHDLHQKDWSAVNECREEAVYSTMESDHFKNNIESKKCVQKKDTFNCIGNKSKKYLLEEFGNLGRQEDVTKVPVQQSLVHNQIKMENPINESVLRDCKKNCDYELKDELRCKSKIIKKQQSATKLNNCDIKIMTQNFNESEKFCNLREANDLKVKIKGKRDFKMIFQTQKEVEPEKLVAMNSKAKRVSKMADKQKKKKSVEAVVHDVKKKNIKKAVVLTPNKIIMENELAEREQQNSKTRKQCKNHTIGDVKKKAQIGSAGHQGTSNKVQISDIWNSPRRHRVASLNALAKVHCLYENESGGVYLGGFCKPKFEKEKDSLKVKDCRAKNILNDNKLENVRKKTKTKRVPPIESKHPVNIASYSSLKTQNNQDCKKKEEFYNNVKNKKVRKIKEVMDLKDMVVSKRMASLNASAILAASYLDERHNKMSSSSSSESSSDSDVKLIKRQIRQSESELAKRKKKRMENTDKKKKVSNKLVIVNKDTDVTITGVYVNQTRSTHHEEFCSIAGMQYRISSTSHTQTAATAVSTELHDKKENPSKSYTPLGALSSMQPPDSPSMLTSSPQRYSAFSVPHPQGGCYQPAGPLIQYPSTTLSGKTSIEFSVASPTKSENLHHTNSTTSISTSSGENFFRPYCPQYFQAPMQYQEICYPTYTHSHMTTSPFYEKYISSVKRPYYHYDGRRHIGGELGSEFFHNADNYRHRNEHQFPYCTIYPPPPSNLMSKGAECFERKNILNTNLPNCPCPMQSCSKNGDTGLLIGNGKGAPVKLGFGLSLPPSTSANATSPLQSLPRLATSEEANAWVTDRLSLKEICNSHEGLIEDCSSYSKCFCEMGRAIKKEDLKLISSKACKAESVKLEKIENSKTPSPIFLTESTASHNEGNLKLSGTSKLNTCILENNNLMDYDSYNLDRDKKLDSQEAERCDEKCVNMYNCNLLDCRYCEKYRRRSDQEVVKQTETIACHDESDQEMEVKLKINDRLQADTKKTFIDKACLEVNKETSQNAFLGSSKNAAVPVVNRHNESTVRHAKNDNRNFAFFKNHHFVKRNLKPLESSSQISTLFDQDKQLNFSKSRTLSCSLMEIIGSVIQQGLEATQNIESKNESNQNQNMNKQTKKNLNRRVNPDKCKKTFKTAPKTLNVKKTKINQKDKNIFRTEEKSKQCIKNLKKLKHRSLSKAVNIKATKLIGRKNLQSKVKERHVSTHPMKNLNKKGSICLKVNNSQKAQIKMERKTENAIPKFGRDSNVIKKYLEKKTSRNELVRNKLQSTSKMLHLSKKNFLTPKWSNGWSWDGQSYEKKVFLSNETVVARKCYHSMKHQNGDLIRPSDCVLLRSGPRKNDIPFVAKVAALWENPEDGEMMFSLLWYYRPEHTEQGRRDFDRRDEVFASRHRDTNSVACIEDKCYILTFNEYCRYRTNIRRLEEGLALSYRVVPAGFQIYPRADRQPPTFVSQDVVLFCRRVYDYRGKKLVKNPG